MKRLVVIETHPIQYHAPVYQVLQRDFGIPVTVIYGSDFSVTGYRDREFGTSFAWDTDLLSGYTPVFLSRTGHGGARSVEQVKTRGLREALRDAAPDAVMLVAYSPRFHQKSFMTAWRAGYPILFRGETNDEARERNLLKDWVRDRGLRWMYRHCERLLYVGQRSRRHFERLECPKTRLVHSPYCVDTAPFQSDEEARTRLRGPTRAMLNIGTDKKVIVFSGKLSARKGPDLLLQAIKRMPAGAHGEVVVLFLGSGDKQGELQALAQHPPIVTAHFLGFQNLKQLSQYYHAADILVLPSVQSETWGLVVNDGLHHGLPCVVSEAVGSGPDLIEPGVTGAMFKTGSAEHLAVAMTQVLPLTNHPHTREMCREKVSNYTIEKAAAGIAEAFFAVTRAPKPVAHCV